MKKEYARVFRALSDENRLRVIELLCDGEQCACVLLDDMNISQPTLSHHMKILCESGIVKSRRLGKWNYYSIDEEGCDYAHKLIDAISSKKMNISLILIRIMNKLIRCSKKQLMIESSDNMQTFESCCERK